MPPNFRNHGNYVISVSKLSRFLAEQAEEKGAYILTETVADKLLVSDRIVRGVRSGDRGRGKDGEPLGNFEPGSDVVARATVLAEGTLGHLTQAAIDYFDLAGSLPVRWELGVKEVWEVGEPLDRVIHTMGWPLRKRPKYNEFGGSFIYPMGEDKLCIGMVIGLDYTDSTLSCHDLLQELKTHPFVAKLLYNGKRVAWGAKTIPSGGYFALPRTLAVPGMAIAGDARQHGQRADPEGHPLRDARRHLRGGGDRRGAEARLGQPRGLRRAGPQVGDRQRPVRVAQHAPAVLEGLLRRRRDGERDDRHQGPVPRRPVEVRARHRDRDE